MENQVKYLNYKLKWADYLSDERDAMKTQVGGKHYLDNSNPVEFVELITQYFGFCIGNAVKYIIRCTHKGNPFMDLSKAVHYMALHKHLVKHQAIKPVKLDAKIYKDILDKLYSYSDISPLKQHVLLLLIDWAQDFKPETQTKFIEELRKLLCVAAEALEERKPEQTQKEE